MNENSQTPKTSQPPTVVNSRVPTPAPETNGSGTPPPTRSQSRDPDPNYFKAMAARQLAEATAHFQEVAARHQAAAQGVRLTARQEAIAASAAAARRRRGRAD